MSIAPVWQSSDEQLLAELGALERQLHATWAQMLSVVAEIDSRRIAATKGYGTTVELVRAIARVPRSEARSRVGTQQRAQVQAELARQARILDAGQLAVLGKRMLAYLDQDGRPPKDKSRDPALVAGA